MLFVFYRQYATAYNARAGARVAFKEAFIQRYRRRAAIHCPIDLKSLPEFTEWLKEEVEKANNSDEKPTVDVYESSRLLERMATGYRTMYAHGMHLRI